MDSILNVTVSCFRNYDTPTSPVGINLLTWLGSDKYAKEVQAIRSQTDKGERDRIKATIPCITPSGTFSYRAEKNLTQHSGFIQFDIDFKDNTHISNYLELKQQLSIIPNVAYCGLSVSGTGYWGLIPIAYPDKHKQHFAFLKSAFENLNIRIDPAPSNVASLRGYSYDPDAHFNHQAQPLFQYEAAKEVEQQTRTADPTDNEAKVQACISEIIRRGVDITGTYKADWLPIGCNFASTFGDDGRDYFHQVSQFHPKYTHRETERQFDHCLKSTGPPDLRTFFARCKTHGINYTDLLKPEDEEQTVTTAPKMQPAIALEQEYYKYTLDELTQALGRSQAIEKLHHYKQLSEQYSGCKSFVLHGCTLLQSSNI